MFKKIVRNQTRIVIGVVLFVIITMIAFKIY